MCQMQLASNESCPCCANNFYGGATHQVGTGRTPARCKRRDEMSDIRTSRKLSAGGDCCTRHVGISGPATRERTPITAECEACTHEDSVVWWDGQMRVSTPRGWIQSCDGASGGPPI